MIKNFSRVFERPYRPVPTEHLGASERLRTVCTPVLYTVRLIFGVLGITKDQRRLTILATVEHGRSHEQE
jgi:hypothetical protein